MKLNNVTSLDPQEARRGVRGLAGASARDREVWAAFQGDPRQVERAEELWSATEGHGSAEVGESPPWFGPTDAVALGRVRLAQRFFRRVVLANFEHRCALTGIRTPELLVASHVEPVPSRALPVSGIHICDLKRNTDHGGAGAPEVWLLPARRDAKNRL